MTSLSKLTTVKENYLQQLRSFYNEVELNMRLLVPLVLQLKVSEH